METTDKTSLVERAFRQLQAEGKVKTQGDFARLLGVSQNTISAAKNGDPRYLTPSLISKIGYLLEHSENDQPSSKTLPVIPIEAMAGTLGEFADSINAYDCVRICHTLVSDNMVTKSAKKGDPEGTPDLQIFIQWRGSPLNHCKGSHSR